MHTTPGVRISHRPSPSFALGIPVARMLLYGSPMRFSDSTFTTMKIPAEDGFGWPRLLALAVALTAAAAALGLLVAGA